MKTNTYTVRLNDLHTNLLKTSALLNDCSRSKVLEDCINKYYDLKIELKRT